jgi:hypothetical protein
MFYQSIMGKPKKCLNRNCKTRFYKESLMGYAPHTNTTVLCIMKCPKCKDTFAIVQAVSIIKEYTNELPCRPKTNRPNLPPITSVEINQVHQKLEEDNLLDMLKKEAND